MSDRIDLSDLPEPDISAPDRIWSRFQARRRRTLLPIMGLAGTAVAVAACAWFLVPRGPAVVPDVQLDGSSLSEHQWSDTVTLDASGAGSLSGTEQRLDVQWTSGTFEASVTPNTGTEVVVTTAEAHVEVVGTVFDVTRDRLGTTVHVTRGTVRVTCEDGWEGLLDASGSQTCLPTSAAGMLGRAEELSAMGAGSDAVLDSIGRGIRLAARDAERGELLVLRMQTLSELGDVDSAVSDATSYLALQDAPRAEQVQRFAGWLVLEHEGCEAALPWLTPLAQAGAGPETVLVAECLETRDPDAAHDAIVRALPTLQDTWSDRAMGVLSRLERR